MGQLTSHQLVHPPRRPVHVLLSKTDKLSRGKASAQLFSATARTGLDQAWQVLDQWLGVAD